MDNATAEKLKNWDDWSYEGAELYQLLRFKALPLEEKLEAIEHLARTAEEFQERARLRKEKTNA